MTDIDAYATSLLEQAKHFLESAKNVSTIDAKQAYLNAAMLLAVSSLEAHVNAVAEELLIRDGLTVLERSLLGELEYTLKKGEFTLTNRLKMYRLEDRIHFVFRRFTKVHEPSVESWWQGLGSTLDLRNKIVHAKAPATLTDAAVVRALSSVLDCLNALYKALYKKGYPGYARGLNSSVAF